MTQILVGLVLLVVFIIPGLLFLTQEWNNKRILKRCFNVFEKLNYEDLPILFSVNREIPIISDFKKDEKSLLFVLKERHYWLEIKGGQINSNFGSAEYEEKFLKLYEQMALYEIKKLKEKREKGLKNLLGD